MRRKIKDSELPKAFDKLLNLYQQIPDTNGCMDNIKECHSWCCQNQNPNLVYCEFLRTWNHILKTWDGDKIISLVERALQNYLSDLPVKGCIFRNEETHLCDIHKYRPLSCMLYAITPKEEFDERLEKIKARYKGQIGAFFRDQCPLVETVNGKKVTTKDTDKWWTELKEIERSIGIEESHIVDRFGGTYLTFHDHLLIYLLPEYLFNNLASVRQYGNIADKHKVIETFIKVLRPAFEGNKNAGNEENKGS